MPRHKATLQGYPWYRKSNDTWYISDPATGKQQMRLDQHGQSIKGRDHEAQAVQAWHEMMRLAQASAKGEDNPLVRLDELTHVLQQLVYPGP